jgi:hypothetical protein
MTILQLHLLNGATLIITAVVAVMTRATARRVAGALIGSAACGPVALGIVVFCGRQGWWRMPIKWEAYFLTLLWIDIALWAYVFLITWRIARRFDGRGLAVTAIVAAVIGPFRDSWYMAQFHWGSYAPGWTPMLAISVAYLLLGLTGHGIMRLVAGPAASDTLARRPWDPA